MEASLYEIIEQKYTIHQSVGIVSTKCKMF